MVQLVLTMLMFAAVQPIPGGGGPGPVIQPERAQGVTAPINTFLLPPKLRDCRTDADIRAALDARRAGDFEPCDPDPMLRRRR